MKVLSEASTRTGPTAGRSCSRARRWRSRTSSPSEGVGIVIIHQGVSRSSLELSVEDNIFLGNEIVDKGLIHRRELRVRRSLDLLARVGLDVDVDTPIKTLGVGQQQLVEIAKALAKNVKILILDQPTSALNEDDSENLLVSLMKGLKGRGITSIMISFDKLNEIAVVPRRCRDRDP